jgi:ribosomal protein S18 acetylase RimI-like enzyme
VPEVVLEKTRASAVAKRVLDGLIRHNRTFAGPIRYKRLVLSAREGRRIVGGLVADCAWNYVYVHLLWVDEAARGKDHGRRLMREAERVARKRGAALVYLNTFTFQAPKFYEKLGYRRFAALKNTPASGTTRYFYVKRLSGARA